MEITEINKNDFLFINVPEVYENFKIMQYGFAGTYIMETDSKSLNHWKINIPRGNYEIVGFINSELTSKNFALKKLPKNS